jgi:hypothetical protein
LHPFRMPSLALLHEFLLCTVFRNIPTEHLQLIVETLDRFLIESGGPFKGPE